MALLKNASPSSTNAQLYNAMIGSAIDIESAGTDRDSGAGIFMLLPAMNALGVSGVSEAFDEDNLGGTSFRLKISVGR